MLLAERSTEDIADILHVSPKTVANTRYLIKAKLGVSSDIELVLVALRQGILGGTRHRSRRERTLLKGRASRNPTSRRR